MTNPHFRTVHPYPDFEAHQDAELLRKAMKGLGTDEKAIIDVLANRSNAQRLEIATAYKESYERDLITDLKCELSGDFQGVITGLMIPTYEYLASEIHWAVKGAGPDDDTLIEIFCTRKNDEISQIIESYRTLYGRNIKDDILDDEVGDFKRLIMSLITKRRSEETGDEEKSKETAKALYDAGVSQWGSSKSVFHNILVSESFEQLAKTFKEYEKLAGHTVAEAIGKMSENFKNGLLLAIVGSVENAPKYFSERLHKSMKGAGTDERTLTRIVISRCEEDMVTIKEEYEKNYKISLLDAICDNTSSDYRRVLVALVKGS